MATGLRDTPATPGAGRSGWSLFLPAIRGEGTAARRAWRRGYVRRALALDAACALVAALVGHWLWFDLPHRVSLHPPLWAAVVLPVVWLPTLLVGRAYEERFLWVGVEEYRRVLHAALALLAVIGTVAWGLELEVARGFVVVALPLALFLTLVQRWVHRHWLYQQRRSGRYQQTLLLVGHRSAVAAMDEQLARDPSRAYRVIGCCLPPGEYSDVTDAFEGLPVLGGVDDVADVVTAFEVDSVAVLPSQHLAGARLRSLGWRLEDTLAELLLAPSITDIAGPRVHIRPLAGLPLLHMERPELTGIRRLTKETVDRTGALVGLLMLSPVIIGIALAVRLTSPGPVFFRQERVGRRGETFTMLKFRSMVPGADRMVETLVAEDEGNGVLFKMREDPRVTRVGKVLRRYSLDEPPQMIKVVPGDLSLVAPRPPLAREVERYSDDMHRRFLVKPGLTGLWQVSGRSDLSWDESVRIDVQYVENWSLLFDLMILWKTIGAVVRGSGAY